MRSLMHVWMNKQGLHDIDPAIVVLDVEESEPKTTISTAANVKSNGMHITNVSRDSLQVAIAVEVHEYSMEKRARLVEKLQAWAQDGSLTVSYRPGQRLECICTKLPALGSALAWTNEVTIAYTAFIVPYWVSDNLCRGKIDVPSAEASVPMRPAGTAKQTPLNFTIRNEGTGNLTSLTVKNTANNTKFELTGLSVAVGGEVTCGYDDLGYLYIKSGDTSLLNKRTPASSDDVLLLQQAANTVQVTANVPVTGLFSARGRFL